VFWVGAIFVIAGFLMPTAHSVGPESGRFMQHLMLRRRLPIFLWGAMLLTVISGFTMYARMTAATHGTWASTAPGIGYGVGGLAAILAAILGGAISGPAARRLGAIGQQAAQSGGLSAEQQSEVQRLQSRATLGSRLTAGLLAVATGAMAIARYL
ncbi:MAG TPA: hypothetical protein VE399_06075, partial [Gemmatimonadales bacterium]|nr:hypothetical protein [Gemmatimonadales bacterium]